MNVINLQVAKEMAHKHLGLRNLVLINFIKFGKTPKVFKNSVPTSKCDFGTVIPKQEINSLRKNT